MISTSKRLAGLQRFISSRPIRYLAALLVIFQALGTMPALATPVAISVNFGGNVAGFAGDTAQLSADWGGTGQFINWNNYANGAALAQVNLNASSTAGPSIASGVNMNVVMYNAAGTMGIVNNAGGSTGAVSADDQQLMNNGLLSQGGVAANATTTITFSNLNAFFTSGYKVYVYADAGTGNTPGGIFGSVSVTNPAGMTHTPGALQPFGNNNAFANDWTSNGHRAKVTNGAGNIVNNTLTITDIVNVFQTGLNGAVVVTGVQIVGDVVTTTPGKFNLTANNVASPTVITGGTTTFDSKINNVGTGSDDTINYTGLSATASSGSVVGGPGSGGPVAQSASGTQALTYNSTGVTGGAVTLTPVFATATNATAGGDATNVGPTTTANVNVLDHSNGNFGNVTGAAAPTFGLNALTLDFGTVTMGAGGGFLDSFFDVFNTINTPGFTAAMDLDTNVDTTGAGSTGMLFRAAGATTFSNLAASLPAGGQPYTYRLATTSPGSFLATYQFRLSDENLPGATAPNSEVLTLTLLGNVVVPEPSTWALGVIGSVGMLGYLLVRRRRRDKT